MIGRRVFALLLALFPRHFRAQYGADMRDVFLDQWSAARRGGRRAATRHLWRSARRMAIAAWHERRHAHSSGPALLSTLGGDVRLTLRAVVRSPLSAAATVLVIAVGIGGVTTIASAMNALVLRPLPGTESGRALFTIDRRSADLSEGVSVSADLYRHLNERSEALDGLAVWSRVTLSIRSETIHEALPGNIVSPDYFTVLGLRPAVGRFFSADDPPSSFVMSHRLWTMRFGGRFDIVGRPVTINGRPYTVVGVTPEGFRGVFTPLRIDGWVPLRAQPHVRPGRDLASAPWLWMFGRVASGVTVEQARTELTTHLSAWIAAAGDPYPRYSHVRFTPLTGLPDDARRAIFGFSGLLLAAALIVLLVAGANVSSLLASRAQGRRQEMGIRTALGGSRRRLAGQLLAETLLLFALGAGGGLVLASAGTTALESVRIPGDVGLHLELSPDWRVALATALLGLTTGIAFGLGPALRGATIHPATLLRASTAGAGTRQSRLTSTLIVGQLAASLVLLSVTTLLGRAVTRGEHMTLGFEPRGVLTSVLNAESWGHDEAQSRAFFERLERSLRDHPSIDDLSFGHVAPLVSTPSGGTISVVRDGQREQFAIESTVVAPRFFETLGIPVLSGRTFSPADGPRSPSVAVVTDVFASRVFPGVTDVVGRSFDARDTRVTIAGVVGSAKWGELAEPAMPFVYFPMAQRWSPSQTLFVKSADPAQAARVIGDTVRQLDAAVPAPMIGTLAQDISVALFPQRLASAITRVLGAGALVLSAAGLYGVLTLAVAGQRRELGVRLALGATRAQVIALVVRRGLRLTAVGVFVGVAGSMLAAPLTTGLLLGGDSLDPWAFGLSAGMLTMVAMLATLVPARRAAAVDPVQVLR